MISAPKIDQDLLWAMTILFFILMACFFYGIFYYRNKLNARKRNISKCKNELSPMISEFIFYEEDPSKDEMSSYIKMKIEIRELIKDKFYRAVLSEILLDLRKDISGDSYKRLLKLYQDLGLHNDAFINLKSWRWQKVAKAILDLTQMEVIESYDFIAKLINDKRATIRKQAEIAIVTLKQEGINYFLDTTKHKISEWQQLKLIEVIRNFDEFNPPKFKAWLTSTNTHVVLFALRLIKYYNQNDAKKAVIELIKHKNNKIKLEAIGCIKEFHFVDAIPTLKGVFHKSSPEVKIAILDTIGLLGNTTDVNYLNTIVAKESNFLVKNKAISSINTLIPDSILPTKDLLNINSNEHSQSQRNNAIDQEKSSKIKKEERKVKSIEIDESPTMKQPEANKDNKAKESEIDFLSIDFLPIVTDINEVKKDEVDEKQETQIDISEITVNYKEIKPEKAPDYSSIDELTFLPIVTESKDRKEVEETETELEKNIEETKFQGASKELENKDSSDYKKYQTAEILNISTEFEEITTEKLIENISVNDPSLVEKTKSGEDIQAVNVSEINVQLEENPESEIKSFNVFEDLFRFCDLEAKLILLDEVVPVGDEGDIDFLTDLSKSDIPALKEKGTIVLEGLKEKLKTMVPPDNVLTKKPMENLVLETPKAYSNLMEDLSIKDAVDADDIFDIGFSIDLTNMDDDDTNAASSEIDIEINKKQASLIQQLLSFSNRMYDKLNG